MQSRQKTGFLPAIDPVSRNRRLMERVKQPKSSPACPESEKTTTISEDDIARFLNPLHQNLCVSMLQDGFHRSFAEFFSLIQSSKASQLAAEEEGSALWHQCPLEDQPRKLETLREHLTRAEAAERCDQYEEVYDNYLALAKFFSDPDDRWLQQHFYELSLLSTHKVISDFGKREAEVRAHIGKLHLEQGDMELAQEHYEVYHQLVMGQLWKDESGHTYQSHACRELCKVYTLLAEKQLLIKEYRQATEILTKAYDMAKKAGDKRMEGEAAYRLALTYQSNNDHRTAKQFLHTFVEISTALGDSASMGKAYKAFAESLEGEGKVNESLQYLQKYAEISQESNQDQNLVDACICLGSAHSSRGEFDRGCEYFIRACKIASDLGSVPLLRKTQAYVGIARAHSRLREYSALIADNRPQSIHALIQWKEGCKEFQKPSV